MTNLITLPKKDLRRLAKEYKNGSTLRELSDEWELSLPVVRRLLTQAGVTIRPRGPQPKS